MHYSFSTVYTAIISSNVLLILLTLCFCNKKIMINAGYRLLALFISFTLIRFLLPFELPFTKTVCLPEWISSVIMWVRHPLFLMGNYEISIWTFLQIIWLLGFVIKLILYIRTQIKTRYKIFVHSIDVTAKEPYQRILNQICTAKNKKNVFQVWTVSGIQIPLLYGIFRPRVLIPDDLKLSEEDLYYVLAHEVSHHFHHDLISKTLIRFIDMIYWWNPFCRILVRQADIILEMRIDDTITVSDSLTAKNYLGCLIRLKEHATQQYATIPSSTILPLLSPDDDEMVKRFEMLIASFKPKNPFLNLALLVSMLSIYVLSYTFIFEAYYAIPEVEESSMGATDEAFYAILKEDNTYDIYYNGILLENTDSLEYHIGIQVYTEKEYNYETP